MLNFRQTWPTSHASQLQQGTTLIEVLVTILVLAFGLLGLAGLQSQVQKLEFESFQRAQAILLLNAMSERINTNRDLAASYVTAGTIGTGDVQPTDCSSMVIGPNRDLCEWSNTLKGASENKGSAKVGAMVGALGCITQIQAPNPATGICTPATYQVTVAWQGLYPTKAQAITCGKNAFGSDDSLRRAISTQQIIGLTKCS